jgi:predicted CopG family antitoxin
LSLQPHSLRESLFIFSFESPDVIIELVKKRKKYQAELEASRLREREIQDKIEEDAKELERMASKQMNSLAQTQTQQQHGSKIGLAYGSSSSGLFFVAGFSSAFLLPPDFFEPPDFLDLASASA